MSAPELLSSAHPEKKPGEIFLTNCNGDEPDEFNQINYQTKRAGRNSYDQSGQLLSNHFPVFVWETEYNHQSKEVKIGH
jgi:hypothetical protein